MKKARMLALLFAMLMLFTACSGQAAPAATTAAAPAATTAAAPAATTAAPATTPAAPQVKPVTLKFSITQAVTDPMAVYCQKMIAEVEKQTNGAIKFEFYPNGELGNLADVMEQIQRGAPIIMSQGADYLGNFVPDHGAMNAQYMYTEWTDIEKLCKSDWYAGIQDELSKKGIKVLAMNWFAGYRHIMSNKVINSPADTKGIKIRVPNNAVFTEFVKSLGAAPVPTNWNEVYTSLQQKVVDGCEAPLGTMYSSSLFEVAKNIALTGHNITCTGIIMGQGAFETLSEDYQKIMLDVAFKLGHEFGEENEKQEMAWRDKFKEKGVTFNEVDVAAFRQAVKAMYDKVPGWSPGIYDTIQKAIGR